MKYIIANFKMNPCSVKEANELLSSYDIKSSYQIILCPPFCYLKKGENYSLGAQNCFYEKKGAYTGEISSEMLKEIGCEYIILGHSERRAMGENNELIKSKIKACFEAKIKPILCIGEKEEEDRDVVIKNQLKGVSGDLIVAYEPIWAIGTGKVPTIDDIKESFNLIKSYLNVPVLYGGSVKTSNIKEILSVTDGVLVGGASLDKKEFLKIICD